MATIAPTKVPSKPYLIRFVLMAIRTIPSFVYALLFIPVVGLGSSAGVMVRP